MKHHHYAITTKWTGNLGKGTADYRSYNRNHVISALDKQVDIPASADPSFLGDAARYNPEELFLSSLSSCHMLWYLHICSVNGVIVTGYTDQAKGTMEENENGSGRFVEVILHPVVTVANENMVEMADQLHHQANEMCFIANSCNFPVRHQSTAIIAVEP
ncbi:OsmC family protein [Pedobacter sp. L105]|uniref:OsmC family protein n=1 Tax=Pedobacter sp. L105 TaxID=1641871 RepID=UPI00131E3294|nr:OsmC family protein [Pedobacter sp. L105]